MVLMEQHGMIMYTIPFVSASSASFQILWLSPIRDDVTCTLEELVSNFTYFIDAVVMSQFL